MTHFDQEFSQYVAQAKEMLELRFNQQPLASKKPLIIVGLSGGPDSVFLLYLLTQLAQQYSINLAAAHLDHGWRENSAHDVQWCKQLCEKLAIPFYHEHAKNLTLAIKPNGSQEALGRQLRRTFFDQLSKKLGADLVALGHHADDQQETFFLRLLRGTSLNGLRCMDTFSGIYFRPLLNIPKSFITDYLSAHKITYLTDPTNESPTYLRNRIRHHVLPTLQTCDQRFNAKLESTIHHLRAEDDFLQELSQQSFDKIFSTQIKSNLLRGKLQDFQALHSVLQKRVLISWLIQSKAHFTPQHGFLLELLKFLNSPHGGTHQIHETWLIKKQAKFFWIIKN